MRMHCSVLLGVIGLLTAMASSSRAVNPTAAEIERAHAGRSNGSATETGFGGRLAVFR